MASRIFIPDLGKNYILAEDATILLYPFNGKVDDIVIAEFYAKSNKGELVTTQKREFVPLLGNEKLAEKTHENTIKMRDWFMVSDLDFSQAIINLAKTPFKLNDLDPQGKVYLMIEDYIPWSHRRFFAYVPASKKHPYEYYKYINDGNGRVVKEMKSLDSYSQPQLVESQYIWSIAKELNPLLDKALQNYIPIYHTLTKGSKFSIYEMNHKQSSEVKVKVVTIEINDQLIDILPEDLNQFVLE